jgi:hypothetical protein
MIFEPTSLCSDTEIKSWQTLPLQFNGIERGDTAHGRKKIADAIVAIMKNFATCLRAAISSTFLRHVFFTT